MNDVCTSYTAGWLVWEYVPYPISICSTALLVSTAHCITSVYNS